MHVTHREIANEADPVQALADIKARIETRLDTLLPPDTLAPRNLHRAQRHTVLAPGKRFRPLLCVLIARSAGIDSPAIYDIGCAAEIIHAASLILDDLPCMDDADLRRNRPTAHIAFDESTAILTATALLNHAFAIVAKTEGLSAEQKVAIVDVMAEAVGSNGLIAGQLADLANSQDKPASLEEIERLNRQKTGALFDFTIAATCIACEIKGEQKRALETFATQIGLAFQLLDDMKDNLPEADKSVGRDAGKATLLHLMGDEGAQIRLSGYLTSARKAIETANLSDPTLLLGVVETQFALARP